MNFWSPGFRAWAIFVLIEGAERFRVSGFHFGPRRGSRVDAAQANSTRKVECDSLGM